MKKLILTIFVILFSSNLHAQESYHEHLISANEAFATGDYKRALDSLFQAESLARDSREKAVVYNSIGWTYFSSGNNSLARKHIERAFNSAVNIADTDLARKASNNLGILEYSLGNLNESEQYFLNEWPINSDTSDTYLSMIHKKNDQIK